MKNENKKRRITEKTIGEYVYSRYLLSVSKYTLFSSTLIGLVFEIIASTSWGAAWNVPSGIGVLCILLGMIFYNSYRRSFLELVNHVYEN